MCDLKLIKMYHLVSSCYQSLHCLQTTLDHLYKHLIYGKLCMKDINIHKMALPTLHDNRWEEYKVNNLTFKRLMFYRYLVKVFL